MEDKLKKLCTVSKQHGYLLALCDIEKIIDTAKEVYCIDSAIIKAIREEVGELRKEIMVM